MRWDTMQKQFQGLASRALLTVFGVVVMIFLIAAIVVGVAVAVLLLPVFAVRSLFRTGPDRRDGDRVGDRFGGVGGASVREMVCPACGYAPPDGGLGGVCPRCNTVFGFVGADRHTSVEVVQVSSAKSLPSADGER